MTGSGGAEDSVVYEALVCAVCVDCGDNAG